MPEEYFLQLVEPRVAPAAQPWESGLPLEDGATLPFVVERGWVGPAGTYIEQWSIRQGDRIIYRHPAHYIVVRGFQSVRRFNDTVRTPLPLEPGVYDITFVVEGYRMGSFVVEVGTTTPEAPAAPEPAPAGAAPAPVVPASPPPAPPPPAPEPAAPAPARPAPAAPAPVAYTGEDPAAVRKRVFEEELAKGADPRVAEGRAKAAEIKARRAATAAAAAPPPEPAAPAPAAPAPAEPAPPETPGSPPPAEATPEPGAPQAATAAGDGSPEAAPSPLLPGAPEGGGGMSATDASAVRAMILAQEAEKGTAPAVAEALADAAEIRAQRGPWWRPDW